ncbi:twin-arginine translocation pathway signal [Jannaschia sp. CCS1]|uniref:twin-arginine translocation pathway signal n=1 Tax=Jannaschia sp. (strain CCS1) TaxID=290400 RepID=UPI000053CFAF|nr:twin-arginine translocation pathway signal [Jannaschia sp. CCS1]ABD53159.1 Twin-arginine translocation pathway signal [Jannaschia sp. CCS1]
MDRRKFIATSAALPSAALVSTVAAASVEEPHQGWLDEWREITDYINSYPDDDAYTELSPRLSELERLLVETPANTPQGILAKIDYTIEDYGEYFFGCIANDMDRKMLASIRDAVSLMVAAV